MNKFDAKYVCIINSTLFDLNYKYLSYKNKMANMMIIKFIRRFNNDILNIIEKYIL